MLRTSPARLQQTRSFSSAYSGVHALRFTELKIVSNACPWHTHGERQALQRLLTLPMGSVIKNRNILHDMSKSAGQKRAR